MVSKFANSDYDYLMTSLLGETSLYCLSFIIKSTSTLILSYSEIFIEFWDCFLLIGTESVFGSLTCYFSVDLVGYYFEGEAYFDFFKLDELYSSLDVVE